MACLPFEHGRSRASVSALQFATIDGMAPEAGQALERTPASAVSFGPFAFDARNGILSRDGREIPLPPRVIGVLALLLTRPGEVVPRQDLLDRVWKDAFVTDTSLAEAVSFLRSALGDDPQAPRYIQTVHRRGYRFLPVLTRQPGVNPGSDQGQTGVRLGSGYLRSTFAETTTAVSTDATNVNARTAGFADAATRRHADAGTPRLVDPGAPSHADAGAPRFADAGTPRLADAATPRVADAGAPR